MALMGPVAAAAGPDCYEAGSYNRKIAFDAGLGRVDDPLAESAFAH